MNIKEASEQVRGAIRAYLAKDEHGLYRIPFRMQRPIILLGPPGVGKTAVVEQIADDLGVNFVSYSITHHTRQSAIGLPFIAQEEFDGVDYHVSEYTMSEIIAAVHHARKKSGVAEGILFLDEVNCVSETLAPAMLQFLQYKVFGMHQLPEGWVVVCAGNPPEYNRAAREFDPAMLDRLMKIEVEPDLRAWQEYAAAHGVHPAVTSYLEAKPGAFYRVRAAAHGSTIVTARGWEDLSRMLQACEAENIVVPASLAGRYLQDDEIADDFSVYYEMFRKYEDAYRVDEILLGIPDDAAVERAAAAPFDERIALVGLLADATLALARQAVEVQEALTLVRGDVLNARDAVVSADDPAAAIGDAIDTVRHASEVGARAAGQLGDRTVVKAERLRVLAAIREDVAHAPSRGEDAFVCVKGAFNAECAVQRKRAGAAVAGVDRAFGFLDEAFGDDSQETLLFITKLSADPALVQLVSEHGSKAYMSHNKNLLFTERGAGLLQQVRSLGE